MTPSRSELDEISATKFKAKRERLRDGLLSPDRVKVDARLRELATLMSRNGFDRSNADVVLALIKLGARCAKRLGISRDEFLALLAREYEIDAKEQEPPWELTKEAAGDE